MSEKKIGTVKWFNDRKGFGFLTNDDGQDVFAHYSEIRREGFKTLTEGSKVEYFETDDGKGPIAREITPIN